MRVVSALLGYEGTHAYMIRATPPMEGMMCRIGGKVDGAESLDTAIVCEIREEAGCEAVVERIGSLLITYDGLRPTPHTFYRARTSTTPYTTEPSEGTIILLSIDEALGHPKLHPFTKRVVELLLHNEPFDGSVRIGPGPEYKMLEFTHL